MYAKRTLKIFWNFDKTLCEYLRFIIIAHDSNRQFLSFQIIYEERFSMLRKADSEKNIEMYVVSQTSIQICISLIS